MILPVLIRPCAYYDTVDIGGMLVGKDQHAQASGRGRGREENQAGTLHVHQGEGGETGRGMREHHHRAGHAW
jgi:hypothetical protein